MTTLGEKNNFMLFVGTFVSAFLLIFGSITLFLLFMPLITPGAGAETPVIYHPQLPVSPNRDEDFIDINQLAALQMFPELTSLDTVEAGDWIRIPSLNINVPLALSPTLNDADVITTLEQGAALYPNGILPGRLGNVFIAAHSTGEPWKGKYRFAFLKIDQIKPGTVINLDYKGTRYTYHVVDSTLVKPKPGFTVASDRPIPTVTLMACWPLWTINQRMLVTGQLTNITKLTPSPS